MWLKKIMPVISSFLIFGAIFLSADFLFAFNVEEYYPLDENNKWVYVYRADDNGEQVTSQEVSKIKGTQSLEGTEAKVMLSTKFDNQAVAVDAEGVKLYKSWGWSGGDYELYNPAKMLYPNMEKGETKTYTIESAAHNIDDAIVNTTIKNGTLTVTLEAVEDVEVPAGNFKDCLKFVSVYEYKYPHRPASGRETANVWLAPGVGRVKAEYSSTELNTENNKQDKISETIELTSMSIKESVPAESSQPSMPEETPVQSEESESVAQ